jgi:hypothetical protein
MRVLEGTASSLKKNLQEEPTRRKEENLVGERPIVLSPLLSFTGTSNSM